MAVGAKYTILQEVGRGNYGVVYEAMQNSNQTRVAMKRMSCVAPEYVELALQEFWALQSVQSQHRHVVRLEECVLQCGTDFQPLQRGLRKPNSQLMLTESCFKGRVSLPPRTPCFLWFVMEFCDGGTMNDYVLSRNTNSALNKRFMGQIASAITFLHTNQIVHRDLKPDNILVCTGPRGPVLKVADFGLSKLCLGKVNVNQHRFFSACGSDFYMAPEMWEGSYTAKADIFALGIIFWAMIERITFKDASSQKELLGTYVCRGKSLVPVGEALLENPNLQLHIPLKNKKAVPEEVCNLLRSMLAWNPKERPDAFTLELRIEALSYGEKHQRCGA
uniref:non-specific serine/threonine protein kinase n=1 Tax=Geotrypetes seraphini TaxID=260995 RepID=A0A6P8QCZ2_GEOSA|nr:serine/threonine-protein kinase 35-like isoform X2 [Geotrypetes seraphini]